MPDFVYQQQIVSDEEKKKAREIIAELKEDLLDSTSLMEPGKNNVFNPFAEPILSVLPDHKASDITTSHRLFIFATLLATINSAQRPKIRHIAYEGREEIIPIVTFEDLQEAIYLMEYANGLRLISYCLLSIQLLSHCL